LDGLSIDLGFAAFGPRQVRADDREYTEGDKVTTLCYRAPEILFGGKDYDGSIDIWSSGIVFSEMVGNCWHFESQASLLAKALFQAMGTPPAGCGATRGWPKTALKIVCGRPPWPRRVRDLAGSAGEELLDEMLAWEPSERVTAAAAAVHDFFLPLQLKGPLAKPSGPSILGGSRHPWSIIMGMMGVDLLQWLREDFLDASWLSLSFTGTGIDWKTEEGRKMILAGRMSNYVASDSMCGLSLAKLLPLPRFRAFFNAFKEINKELLLIMAERLRAMAFSLRKQGQDLNRRHFLEQPLDSWFGNAGELCVTEADGSWEEKLHQDGAASVVHLGITLYGQRRLVCHVPQGSPVVVKNRPGSFYVGGLTGPHHQVFHEPCPEDQLWQGKYSVTVMLRTTLFPHCRSRVRGTTPHPPLFFFGMADVVAKTFGDLRWALPSLSESQQHFGAAGAVTSGAGSACSRSSVLGKQAAASVKVRRKIRLIKKTKARLTPKSEKAAASIKVRSRFRLMKKSKARVTPKSEKA